MSINSPTFHPDKGGPSPLVFLILFLPLFVTILLVSWWAINAERGIFEGFWMKLYVQLKSSTTHLVNCGDFFHSTAHDIFLLIHSSFQSIFHFKHHPALFPKQAQVFLLQKATLRQILAGHYPSPVDSIVKPSVQMWN